VLDHSRCTPPSPLRAGRAPQQPWNEAFRLHRLTVTCMRGACDEHPSAIARQSASALKRSTASPRQPWPWISHLTAECLAMLSDHHLRVTQMTVRVPNRPTPCLGTHPITENTNAITAIRKAIIILTLSQAEPRGAKVGAPPAMATTMARRK
jgi:hypothetical protein